MRGSYTTNFTTWLICFSWSGWENLLFELGSERVYPFTFKKRISEVVRIGSIIIFHLVSYGKPSSSYCVMKHFWWSCRENLILISLGSERVKWQQFSLNWLDIVPGHSEACHVKSQFQAAMCFPRCQVINKKQLTVSMHLVLCVWEQWSSVPCMVCHVSPHPHYNSCVSSRIPSQLAESLPTKPR